MAIFTLDWANAGPNADYSMVSGADTLGVSITTDTNAEGQTAEAKATGSPSADGLWVSGLTSAVTTTMTFDSEVSNLSFEVFDLDQSTGAWDDRITIIAKNAAGAEVLVSFSDLDGLHTATGNQLDADGNASTGVETSGADDSVTVNIAGPITELVFVFDNGESADNSGIFGISAMTMSASPANGIVEGTANGELIDLAYTGDPDGDMVTTGDDVIEAYGGDDTIFANEGNDSVSAGDGNDFISGGKGDDTLYGDAGDDTINGDEGNDVIYGGDGADTSEMGTGNDTFWGGAGDDWVNGDYGNDTLHGGTGDDFLRGSYGNDTIYSGGAGEGDDYLWGGYNDDTFIIENNFGNDSISGEDQQEVYGDVLDMSGVTYNLTIDLTNVNPGIGTFTDGTYLADFNGIEHIVLGAGIDTLQLADFGGADRVEGFAAPTDNGDGTFTGHDQLDVSALTNDGGSTPVTTADVVVTDDGSGNALLTFPGGESITLVGVPPSAVDSPAELEAIGIPPAPDGIVSGTAGADTISFGYVDADGDFIDNGDASLPGEFGDDDIVEAGAGNDTINAGFGNDEVDAGAGDDYVEGWVGDDMLSGADGDDTLLGQDGDDTLSGGLGADSLGGGEGNDSLAGDAGADILHGDYGQDTLTGGTGNDTLDGGIGADTMTGGDDQDTFVNVGAGDQIFGGEGGDDYDVIDMTGAGPYSVNYDPLNSENGTIDFLDTGGNVTGSLSFEGIEDIVPCFTPGSLISTATGLVPVEKLSVGTKIITRDNGFQKIRWIGHRTIDRRWMNASPCLQPVLIRKDALGDGNPSADLMVSPNHRILVGDANTIAYLGESEVLVAAKHLVGRPGVSRAAVSQITYIHMMFSQHEIVYSNNSWSESFQPGDHIMSGLDSDQRDEIFTLFPELEGRVDPTLFPIARRVIRKHEARILGKPWT